MVVAPLLNVVGVVARPDQKRALEFAVKVPTHLKSRELRVFLEPKLAQYANRPDATLPLEKMKADLVITIGGHGTILRTYLLMPKPEPECVEQGIAKPDQFSKGPNHLHIHNHV